MNSFLISTIALCVVAQCAVAQYGQSPYGGAAQQRKMAPSPQSGYGASSQHQQQMSNYHQQQQQQQPQPQYQAQPQTYGPASKPAPTYRAAAPSYAAPAKPKYEEPYHPPMPFAWGYDINDGYGGAQFHKESGDEYGKRTGSYGYTDAYGIYRQVDYVADEHGFRATVKTNEPGTANEAPADVEWHAYEPPSNHYAGQQQAQSYAAPAQSSGYAPKQQQPRSSGYSAPAPARAAYPTQSAHQPAMRAYPARQQQPASSYEPQPYGAASQNVASVQNQYNQTPKQQIERRAGY